MTDWLWLPSGAFFVGWLALRRRFVLSAALVILLLAGAAWALTFPRHIDYVPGVCQEPFQQECGWP